MRHDGMQIDIHVAPSIVIIGDRCNFHRVPNGYTLALCTPTAIRGSGHRHHCTQHSWNLHSKQSNTLWRIDELQPIDAPVVARSMQLYKGVAFCRYESRIGQIGDLIKIPFRVSHPLFIIPPFLDFLDAKGL
jgi:hypothetical protein